MSNEQKMVSVPRELTREMLNGVCMHPDLARSLWSALLKNAPQPAAQHQGEPVHMVRTHGSSCWEEMSGESLELCMADRSEYEVLKLYKHADSGEVERLRDQLAAWQSLAAERLDMIGLRDTKLAEREALLWESLGELDNGHLTFSKATLRNRIHAALSASAEPSAPASFITCHVDESCGQSAPVERDDLPPFAQKVLKKLRRTQECFEDSQGTDIGRDWLDVLVRLGLLNRVQRSPALWEVSDAGDALLEARAALERKP